MDTENVKHIFKDRFNQNKKTLSQIDWLFKVLDADDTVNSKDKIESEIRYQDKIKLKILPFELVVASDKSVSEIWDEMDGLKYDDFYLEWQNQVNGYWYDKIELLDILDGIKLLPFRSPMDILNSINRQVMKIKKRALIIDFQAASYIQRQSRINEEKVEYNYIRGYWYDKENNKARIISKLVGKKFDIFEDRVNEVAAMYRSLDYKVTINMPHISKNGKLRSFDLLIVKDNVRKVVDMDIDKDTFNNLIILNEMINQFKKDFN